MYIFRNNNNKKETTSEGGDNDPQQQKDKIEKEDHNKKAKPDDSPLIKDFKCQKFTTTFFEKASLECHILTHNFDKLKLLNKDSTSPNLAHQKTCSSNPSVPQLAHQHHENMPKLAATDKTDEIMDLLTNKTKQNQNNKIDSSPKGTDTQQLQKEGINLDKTPDGDIKDTPKDPEQSPTNDVDNPVKNQDNDKTLEDPDELKTRQQQPIRVSDDPITTPDSGEKDNPKQDNIDTPHAVCEKENIDEVKELDPVKTPNADDENTTEKKN